MCRLLRNLGGLNLLEPCGYVQACNGNVLPLPFTLSILCSEILIKRSVLVFYSSPPCLSVWLKKTWRISRLKYPFWLPLVWSTRLGSLCQAVTFLPASIPKISCFLSCRERQRKIVHANILDTLYQRLSAGKPPGRCLNHPPPTNAKVRGRV